jgi:hypothetical protein
MEIHILRYQEETDRVILNKLLGKSYEAHFLNIFLFLFRESGEAYELITLCIDVLSASF